MKKITILSILLLLMLFFTGCTNDNLFKNSSVDSFENSVQTTDKVIDSRLSSQGVASSIEFTYKAKDIFKKSIVKAIQEYVSDFCKEPLGYQYAVRVFDINNDKEKEIIISTMYDHTQIIGNQVFKVSSLGFEEIGEFLGDFADLDESNNLMYEDSELGGLTYLLDNGNSDNSYLLRTYMSVGGITQYSFLELDTKTLTSKLLATIEYPYVEHGDIQEEYFIWNENVEATNDFLSHEVNNYTSDIVGKNEFNAFFKDYFVSMKKSEKVICKPVVEFNLFYNIEQSQKNTIITDVSDKICEAYFFE